MNAIKAVSIGVAALMVGACGSISSPTLKEAIEHEKLSEQRIEKHIDNMPKWFKSPPNSNNLVAFTVGTGTATNLSMSRHKAVLDAQSQLADQIGAVVSSMSKDYGRDSGVGFTTTFQDTEVVTKKVVAEVEVSGYRIENIEIIPEGKYFRVYVLLAYPIGESNTIRLMRENQRAMKSLPAQKEKAFQELDKNISNTAQ